MSRSSKTCTTTIQRFISVMNLNLTKECVETIEDFGLTINYDDAFIAYLNGVEVLRVGVGEGDGLNTKKIVKHNANGFEYFSLMHALKHLDDDDHDVDCDRRSQCEPRQQ